MDTRRLRLLLALSRLGSMRAVAENLNLTTSTVSQQLAALAKETGAQLIEPEGRRVRLTPAGQRLADHAVTILAAVDAARLDSDSEAEPVGTLRIGGFATGIRVSLLPILADLTRQHPGIEVAISEYEPIEAFALLTDDDLDLALTYDYNLAPASPGPLLESFALWSIPWGLGLRSDEATGPAELADYAERTWIVNSRNTADEDAVRTLGALAGFIPRIAHQIDSLELVEDLIVTGYGVGLLPLERPTNPGVTVVPLAGPTVIHTAYAATRKGSGHVAASASGFGSIATRRRTGGSADMAPTDGRMTGVKWIRAVLMATLLTFPTTGVARAECTGDCDAQQRVATADAYLATRPGVVGYVLRDRKTGAVYRNSHAGEMIWTASTIKLGVVVDLFARQTAGLIRLGQNDIDLMRTMLHSSDNDAADTLWTRYGGADHTVFNKDFPHFGMTRVQAQPGFGNMFPYWGFQKSTTDDLDHLVNYMLTGLRPNETAWIIDQMQHVDANQQWGVWGAGPDMAPGNKDGWSDEQGGWVTNSVGFAGPSQRYTLAIMNALGGAGGCDDGQATTSRLSQILLAGRR